MDDELEELFEQQLYLMKAAYVQAITSHENANFLRPIGGVFALASRDLWLRNQWRRTLSARARGRWEEYEGVIRRSVSGGTPPHIAIERFLRTRANAIPHTIKHLEEQTRVSPVLTGDGGGYSAPKWQHALIDLRRRVRSNMSIMTNTVPAVAALSAWMAGELYRWSALGETLFQSDTGEWDTPLAFAAPFGIVGDIAEAYALRRSSRRPSARGARTHTVYGRGDLNTNRTGPASRRDEGRGSSLFQNRSDRSGFASSGTPLVRSGARRQPPAMTERFLDPTIDIDAIENGPFGSGGGGTFTPRNSIPGRALFHLARNMPVDQRRAAGRIFGKNLRTNAASPITRRLRAVWLNAILPQDRVRMQSVVDLMSQDSHRNSPEHRRAYELSGKIYNGVRRRFWRGVYGDPALRRAFREAGLSGVEEGLDTAPYYEIDYQGQTERVQVQMDHEEQRIDNPARALDADNVRPVAQPENAGELVNINDRDPHQR